MPIHTIDSLARQARRPDRVAAEVHRVVAAMKQGAILLRTNRALTTCWVLSNGTRVSNQAAHIVTTAQENVVGVSDAFFDRALSQTFRWVEDDHD
jgi:hypothetical protein